MLGSKVRNAADSLIVKSGHPGRLCLAKLGSGACCSATGKTGEERVKITPAKNLNLRNCRLIPAEDSVEMAIRVEWLVPKKSNNTSLRC